MRNTQHSMFMRTYIESMAANSYYVLFSEPKNIWKYKNGKSYTTLWNVHGHQICGRCTHRMVTEKLCDRNYWAPLKQFLHLMPSTASSFSILHILKKKESKRLVDWSWHEVKALSISSQHTSECILFFHFRHEKKQLGIYQVRNLNVSHSEFIWVEHPL